MALQDITENKGSYEFRHKLFQKLKLLKINKFIKCLNIPGSKKKGEILGVDAGILLKTHIEKMSDQCLSKMLLKTKILSGSFPRY
jgi:hypothetical protein